MSGSFGSLHGQPPIQEGSTSTSVQYGQTSHGEPSDTFGHGSFNVPPLSIDPQFDPSNFDPSSSFESPRLISPHTDAWAQQGEELSPQEPTSASNPRRKASDADHVKHRRTRSGCYTCRNRRVKCDEQRPICERCRKGARECVYPDPKADGKSGTKSKIPRYQSKENVRAAATDTADMSHEADHESTLPTSPIHGNTSEKQSNRPRPARRASRPGKIGSSAAVRSPTTEKRTGSTLSSSPDTDPSNRLWASLPQDEQFYLEYFSKEVNYTHYQFKNDGDNFFKTTLLETALQYEPLRYAVVGFAAFHYIVQEPKGKLTLFLTYYNRAVSSLRKSLQSAKPHDEAMLITILQLASFEEFLGDWVNLFGHQRAAYEMLLKLYDPESINNTATGRTIFKWYTRFDLFAGLMARSKTTLGIEWFRTFEEQWDALRRGDPSNLKYQIESIAATHQLLAWEIACLNAKLPEGEIDIHEYTRGCESICERVESRRSQVAHIWAMKEFQVNSLDAPPDPEADAIFGPYQPGEMLQGEAFALNYADAHLASVATMAKHSLSLALQRPAPPEEMLALAIQQMRMVDRLWRWPGSIRGAIMPVQTCVPFASLFVPRSEQYTTWCRKMLAHIECQGYIIPTLMRSKLAEAWGISTLDSWWLPDPDSCPPVIRSLRTFVDERTTKPRDQLGEDIRTMKALFRQVNLGSSPSNSPDTAHTIDSGSSSGVRGGGGAGAGAFRTVGSPNSDSIKEESFSP